VALHCSIAFCLCVFAPSIGLAQENAKPEAILPRLPGGDRAKAIAFLSSHKWALVDGESDQEVAIFGFSPDGKVTVEKKADAQALGAKLLETTSWKLRPTGGIYREEGRRPEPMFSLDFIDNASSVIDSRDSIFMVSEGMYADRYCMEHFGIATQIEIGETLSPKDSEKSRWMFLSLPK